MRKTLLVLLTTSLIPSTLLANESKSGLYITGKMGASIMQMSGQFFPASNPSTNLDEKLKGKDTIKQEPESKEGIDESTEQTPANDPTIPQ